MNTPGPIAAGFFAAIGRIVIRLSVGHLICAGFAHEWPPRRPQLVGARLRHVCGNGTRPFGLVLDSAVVPGRDDGQVGSRFGDGDRAGSRSRDRHFHGLPYALNRLRASTALRLRAAGEQRDAAMRTTNNNFVTMHLLEERPVLSVGPVCGASFRCSSATRCHRRRGAFWRVSALC